MARKKIYEKVKKQFENIIKVYEVLNHKNNYKTRVNSYRFLKNSDSIKISIDRNHVSRTVFLISENIWMNSKRGYIYNFNIEPHDFSDFFEENWSEDSEFMNLLIYTEHELYEKYMGALFQQYFKNKFNIFIECYETSTWSNAYKAVKTIKELR